MKKSSANFIHRLILLCLSLFAFFFTACGNGVGGMGSSSSVSVPSTRSISGSLSLLPTISNVSPLLGNTDGNWTLTVTGSDFTDGMIVMVGSVACTSVTVLSSESLTCTAPANAAGATAVSVSNANGHLARMESATTYVDAVTVSQFTPTATGFQANFNRAIKLGTNAGTPEIHIYDDGNGLLGEADVTLEGESTGPVRGSLVIDQAYKRFTFIRTGAAILAPDTYTVRLKSGATGVRDAGDAQLDGDDNGTVGDDFETTFTISAVTQGLTVGIPDFMRGPGQTANIPNTSTGIPLQLVDNDLGNASATSIQFTVVYNPNLLTITGISNGSDKDDDTTLSYSQSVAGRAIITIDRTTGLVGAGPTMDFVRLTATVPTTATYGSTHLLSIEDVTIGGVSEPATVNPGLHVVGYFGDLTRNGTYSGSDTSRSLRLIAGLDPGLRNWCWIDPYIAADINGSLSFTSLDSDMQAQVSVGIPVALIPSIPLGLTLIHNSDP